MTTRETTFRETSFREKTIRESNYPGNDCKPLSSSPPHPSSSDLFLVTRRYVLNMSKADWMDFGRLETANFNMRLHLCGTAHISAVWRWW